MQHTDAIHLTHLESLTEPERNIYLQCELCICTVSNKHQLEEYMKESHKEANEELLID